MLHFQIFVHLLFSFIVVPPAHAELELFPSTVFAIKDTYIGGDFFNGFDFVLDDPSNGHVNYVSKEEAIAKGLSYVKNDRFFMRADDTNVVPLSARGRDSIRIQSYAAYTDSIVVLDLVHMPEGCSTWPAFRTKTTGQLPVGGEIDIIEGVNLNIHNLVTLHTAPNCTMPSYFRLMEGEVTSNNCDTQVNSNQGCGVNLTDPATYGAPFNRRGGGWYVMERLASRGIAIWFWSRGDDTVPYEVKTGSRILEPNLLWGLPQAYFPFSPDCTADHFGPHNIIFSNTFCGGFAGNAYPTSGCPGTCEDFVNNNPKGFEQAYWEINSLRVYTPLEGGY